MTDTEAPDPITDEPAAEEHGEVESPPDLPAAETEPEPDVFPRNYVEQLRQENGRYRQQLRDRDAQLDAHRRADVERMVGTRILDASLLWAYGATPADLVGEDGRIDPALVESAVDKLLTDHPQFRHPISPAAPAAVVGWSATSPITDTREPITAQSAIRRALGRDG